MGRQSNEGIEGAGSSHRAATCRPRGEVGGGAEPCSDPAIIEGYLRDASGEVGHASALYRPGNEAELAKILVDARSERIPITIVAGQSSTTASSVPRGGWIVSSERLTRIVGIDVGANANANSNSNANAGGGRAIAEPGVVLGEFQDAVEAAGAHYPPDPTSRYECSLGGSVACNASGPRSYHYGATRRWVQGLRVVLTSGDVLALQRGRVVSGEGGILEILGRDGDSIIRIPVPHHQQPVGVKHSGGYSPGPQLDLMDLFIGSEGTLGVVSEVEVELAPKPSGWLELFVSFEQDEDAISLVESLRSRRPNPDGLRLRSLEYFDEACLDLLRSEMPGFATAAQARAALFIEAESHGDTDRDDELQNLWLERLTRAGALVDDPAGVVAATTAAQREELRLARHAIPAGVNERAARNGMPKLGTDLAVPDSSLRAMLDLYHRASWDPRGLLEEAEVRDLLDELSGGSSEGSGAGATSLDEGWRALGLPDRLDALSFGHIGDNHIHVNFLPKDAASLALARAVYAHLTRAAIAMGGSPSAEHGFGKIKHAALEEWIGRDGVLGMLAVKRALDPKGCLGRGNLFPKEALAVP